MLEYKTFDADRMPEIKALFEQEGWRAYLGDDRKLEDALNNSLWLYGAFEDDRLVGFVRCVGDGQHILLIQDLLVDPAFRRRGIGTALLRAAMDAFAHVRMKMLITDLQDTRANAFYQAMGMKPLAQGGMVGYFR